MQIYADNAATTKMSRTAIDAMLSVMEENYGNPSSLHSIGQRAAEELFRARERIALRLGCQPREVFFTSGGSEADNQAIISAAEIGAKRGKKHIISTAFEHHAVLHTLEKLKKEGFDVELLPVGASGTVTAKQVEDAIRPDTCLVSVMYANNEIGSILPISEIGKLCRERGVLFHTDAVQAAGHLPIDVKAQNIDLLSLSAHKFHGPKGVGALYARQGILLTTLIEGGAQERGKRAGTENLPAISGMAAALDEAYDHMEENAVYVSTLRDRLIEGLSKIPHSALNGDPVNRLPGNVSFCFEGIEGESLLLMLDSKGICASSGSACTSGSLDPSHVLLAIGRPHEIAHGSLRLSLCETNTPDEIDYMLKEIPEVVEYLRGMSPLWRDKQSGKKPFLLRDRLIERKKTMALYSEKVMDHFMHPRNVGVIENADGVGEVGNAKCGDIMKIYLKIDNDIITDVKFETFGCGSAIASSSMATEMIKGKPLSEALTLSNKAVAEALDGLPAHKIHCSVLAEEAIKSAVKDYYDKHGIEYDHTQFPDCASCGHCSI